MAMIADNAKAVSHPMDSILVRRLKFGFDQVQTGDLVWSRTHPNFSIFINAFSVHVPHFERFLVAVLREVRGDLADRQLAKDVQAIIGQEAYHASNFEGWTQRMNEHYKGLPAIDAVAKNYFLDAFKTGDRKFKVGYVAGYETFTFLAGMIILDGYEKYMADADPTIRALLVWHQVEEVEHGSVAFDVYKATYGEDEWYRRKMVLIAFMHIFWETFKSYAEMIRVEGYYRPPRQNSCRLHRSTLGAAMKDGLGSIRTDIQRQSGGAVAAAGERSDRRGCARGWDRDGHLGALARGCAVQARPRAGLDRGRPA